MDKRQVTY